MKKTFSLFWLVVLAISGCKAIRASKSTLQNISLTPTSADTLTSEIVIGSTPTKAWGFSNYLDRFTDMAVLPDHKVWAVSTRGTIIQDYLEHANLADRYIENVDFYLSSVSFVSSDDGWIVGSYGQIFHWSGKAWNSVIPLDLQSNISLVDIDFADKDNGWAVGCDYSETDPAKYKGVLLRWNGESLENVSLLNSLARENFCLKSIDVVSATNVWAVGQEFYNKGVTLHWNGTSWKEIPS